MKFLQPQKLAARALSLQLGPIASDSLLIDIRVRSNSSRNKVGGAAGDPPRLIVSVQAPAVDGKANAAVIKELAKAFDLRSSAFTIVSGDFGRDKRVRIAGDRSSLESTYNSLLGVCS